jgi:hypothetical protein
VRSERGRSSLSIGFPLSDHSFSALIYIEGRRGGKGVRLYLLLLQLKSNKPY